MLKKIFLIFLVVVLGVAFAVDAWLRSFAEGKASDRLADVLELEGDAEVSLDGWPFIVKLISGSFPSATVSADSVVSGGARLEDLEVELQDVEFEAGGLLSGSADAVRAQSGKGSARLTQDALRMLTGERSPNVRLSIRNGRLRASTPRLPRAVAARVNLEGNDLVVTINKLGRDVTIALPAIVDGLSYRSISLGEDSILVRFTLADARLTSGEN